MDLKERRKAVQKIGKAVETLPASKREFILGYAEGVLAMANKQAEKQGNEAQN